MALAEFFIHKGANKTFKATIYDETDAVINLTTASVMKVRAINRLSGLEILDLDLVLDGAGTLGKVKRDFVPADTETVPVGIFNGQIKIVFVSGVVYHSPVFIFEIRPRIKQ